MTAARRKDGVGAMAREAGTFEGSRRIGRKLQEALKATETMR